MKTFPTLYKKTSTGAIQYWDIGVDSNAPTNTTFDISDLDKYGWFIVTQYGQVGTDFPQVTKDLISKGKNPGKKNETTAYQQAKKEAQAKWEKQKKKGYVETKEAAQNEELDELIEGGIVPMLAHKYSEQGHKLKYPVYTQPKLDGIRCVAIVKDGACTLWSRTRKPITSMPHIIQELEAVFENLDIILDGELYNHEMKSDFEKIVSLVRQEDPGEGYEMVQYHIYDTANEEAYVHRLGLLQNWLTDLDESSSLRLVDTEVVLNEDEVMDFFDKFRSQGYEGAMMRNRESKYVNKRSYDLLKVKEFNDGEFEIIGIEEGRGKLSGHVGSFVCKMDNGKQFLAKAKGATERLRDYFNTHSLWKGRRLTVQYQGLTGKEGVPRFPVGIAIRDYE